MNPTEQPTDHSIVLTLAPDLIPEVRKLLKLLSAIDNERPMPKHFIDTLPPLPKNKLRWVYRGKFVNLNMQLPKRHICYWSCDSKWNEHSSFSGCLEHIEAVDYPAPPDEPYGRQDLTQEEFEAAVAEPEYIPDVPF